MTHRLAWVGAVALAGLGCARSDDAGEGAAPWVDDMASDAGLVSDESASSPAPDNPAIPSTPTPPAGEDTCAEVEAESTLERAAVDVVWVVDDSGSMLDEQARIRENIARFFDSLVQAGLDARVVVVTESDLAQGTVLEGDANYRFVESDVGSHDSLEVLLETLPEYQSMLRPEARTHFVAVTDDESRLPGADFEAQMSTALGHTFVFHAVASESVNGRACRCSPGVCGAAAPGDEYYALAARTGGEQVSICTLDWGAVFDRLIGAVVQGSPLPCELDLPDSGKAFDRDKVRFDHELEGKTREIPRLLAGECADKVAWRYAANDTQIALCPAACEAVAAGGTLHVAFGCAPAVLQ